MKGEDRGPPLGPSPCPHQATPLLPDPSASKNWIYFLHLRAISDYLKLPRHQNNYSGNYAPAKVLDEGHDLAPWIYVEGGAFFFVRDIF